MHRERFVVETSGRGFHSLSDRVQAVVSASRVSDGLCHVFLHHTSASLIFCENADPTVRADAEAFFGRFIKDGDPLFQHTAEGPDDMAAHLRTILTLNSVSIPIGSGQVELGTWQGLFLWEHRTQRHRRKVTVSVVS